MDVTTAPHIIAIIGPESTGKTTLAQQLATHFNGALVREYAREFLGNYGHSYREDDLAIIAQKQFDLEQQAIASGRSIVVCDTDLLVIKVWSEVRYNRTAPSIDSLIAQQPPRLHLLTLPDLPWEYDPLRENPDDRDGLFDHYQRILTKMDNPFLIVGGMGENRLNNALKALETAMA